MESATRKRFFKDFPAQLANGAASIFVGAGVSMAAGYPSWSSLLREIGEELEVDVNDVSDLAALAQWSISHSGNRTRIRQVIKNEIGIDRDVPDVVQTVARLPFKHLWTTNYDRLIERAFSGLRRPLDVISSAGDLAIRGQPGAARLYKMHGSIDNLESLVIATDDYELYRSRRGAYLPLLQAHLTSMSMLFVGISFSDPNIRHVLSLIRESFVDAPPEHFAIMRPPQRDDFRSDAEYQARLKQHQLWAKDLERYGLKAIEVGGYAEIPSLLEQVERAVASERVWISGSWPEDYQDETTSAVYRISRGLGQLVGERGLSLVTGSGRLVSSAAISGFLDALRDGGVWDMERRLIARPFPQTLNSQPESAKWTLLREELVRMAGTVIFVGGLKRESEQSLIANGMLEEVILARDAKRFLLPIGATGGVAEMLARQLLKSEIPAAGPDAQRPTDAELVALSDPRASMESTMSLVGEILARSTAGLS